MCTERKATGLFVLTSFRCDNGKSHAHAHLTLEKQSPVIVKHVTLPVFCQVIHNHRLTGYPEHQSLVSKISG